MFTLNTEYLFSSLSFSYSLTNTQTSWSVMRLKKCESADILFSEFSPFFYFFFPLPLRLSALHFTPAAWKWQKGRQECEGEGRSGIGWLSCEMLIFWTKTTTVEMRAQIQSVVLPAEDNNRAEKQEKKQQRGRQESELHLLHREERARTTTRPRLQLARGE